jgi:propionyl-CoA synthetase
MGLAASQRVMGHGQQRNFFTSATLNKNAHVEQAELHDDDYIYYPERGVTGPEDLINPKMEKIYKRSIEDREGFFGDLIDTIEWHKRPTQVLSHDDPLYRDCWYPDGELSIVYNAIDKHVEEGRGDCVAFYEYSSNTGREKTWTYQDMYEQTGRLASVMRKKFGVKKGDTVVFYMPMVMEAVVAMMACVRLGAIHCVVFGGFAPKELAVRIDDAKPKLIVTSSMGIEPNKVIPYVPLVEEALTHCKQASNPKQIPKLYYNRPEQNGKWGDNSVYSNPTYFDYEECMAKEKYIQPCVPVKSNDPMYILYTSGTTGAPKGIVRETAGTAITLKYSMENNWDARRGDVQFSTSDIGWIVGHSFIVWGPPLNCVPSVFYDGKPHVPNPGVFWEIVKKYNVTSIFTSPTAMRLLKREDFDGEYIKKWGPTSIVKAVSLAGERLDPDTVRWLRGHFPNTAINDTWWQTEIGWPLAGDIMNQEYRGRIYPTLPGSVCKPNVGIDLKVLDENNNEVERGELGKICIKLPMPPQFMKSIWNRDEAFVEKYLTETPGYYTSGDAGIIDENGYVSIMTRTDDVINTAAHRISTGRLEEVINEHPLCVESAVVGFNDELKGECPLAFVMLRKKKDITKMAKKELDELKKEIQ